jgi:hypothetical protein
VAAPGRLYALSPFAVSRRSKTFALGSGSFLRHISAGATGHEASFARRVARTFRRRLRTSKRPFHWPVFASCRNARSYAFSRHLVRSRICRSLTPEPGGCVVQCAIKWTMTVRSDSCLGWRLDYGSYSTPIGFPLRPRGKGGAAQRGSKIRFDVASFSGGGRMECHPESTLGSARLPWKTIQRVRHDPRMNYQRQRVARTIQL